MHHLGFKTFASAYLQISFSGFHISKFQILHNLNSKHYIDNAMFTCGLQKSTFTALTPCKATLSGYNVKTLNF